MVNKYRGEVEIKVGDKKFIMCPSFNSMVNIEEKTGLSIISLATDFKQHTSNINILSIIIRESVSNISDTEIKFIFEKNGISYVAQKVIKFFENALGEEV